MIIYSGNHSLAKRVYQDTGIDGMVGLLTSYPSKPPKNIKYPFVSDNKKYPVWIKNINWESSSFIKSLNYLKENNLNPQWILCPDAPTNAKATDELWEIWYPVLSKFYKGFKIAFAAQDGHKPEHIPKEADYVFIGGSTQWKHQNIKVFCDAGFNVHVGRINSLRWLWVCHFAGCTSVDGNGWFRSKRGSSTKGRSAYQDLTDYIKIVNNLETKESECLFNLGQYTNFCGVKARPLEMV